MPNFRGSESIRANDYATLTILERQVTHSHQSINKLSERMIRKTLAKTIKPPAKTSLNNSINSS